MIFPVLRAALRHLGCYGLAQVKCDFAKDLHSMRTAKTFLILSGLSRDLQASFGTRHTANI